MSNQDLASYFMRAVQICVASLGMEHPQTQQIMENYLNLLFDMYTGGDMKALLELLAQGEPGDRDDGEGE